MGLTVKTAKDSGANAHVELRTVLNILLMYFKPHEASIFCEGDRPQESRLSEGLQQTTWCSGVQHKRRCVFSKRIVLHRQIRSFKRKQVDTRPSKTIRNHFQSLNICTEESTSMRND